MNPYLAIFKCRFSSLFQYRLAAFAGLTTQIFWGFIKMMIFSAFYAETFSSQPLSLSEAITFIWLGQALLQLVPWNFDKEVEVQIRNGNVAYEMIRPLDLYGYWYFKALAMRFVPTFLRSLPLFTMAGLFFGLSSPASSLSLLAFFVSVLFSLLLSAAITTFVMITFFWTISGEGIMRLLPHIAMLLSGLVVPLPLFPSWMHPFINAQPFRGIIDIPSRLYTGVIPPSEAFFYFAFQLGWTLLFFLLGKMLLNRAIKSFVIQGG